LKILRILVLLSFVCTLSALDLSLEFHGRAFIGKYLNSDTTLYNMDASVDLYCTMVKHKDFSFFMSYRDDLDMAMQTGGVFLDPRYAHYYIVGGFDLLLKRLMVATYFMHDCIHDIDFEVEGTPVFNRFRIQIADPDFHKSNRLHSSKKFIWSVELGSYPHWDYHGWDINAGADYNYEIILKPVVNIFRKNNIGFDMYPTFHITKGDTSYYHQHLFQVNTFYSKNGKRIGLELAYNLLNNDIIKDPDKLWLLSIFVEF